MRANASEIQGVQVDHPVDGDVGRRNGWSWARRAACRGTDFMLFFGVEGQSRHERLAREGSAKAICASCHVHTECLNHALEANEQYGIWGGLTEAERAEPSTEKPVERATGRG